MRTGPTSPGTTGADFALTARGPWVVFSIALAARAAWVLLRWATRGAAFEYPDEGLHWELATHLAEGVGLVSADGRYAARMPLYPLFLAIWATLGTAGVLAARLAQAAVGAATSVLVYRVASDLRGPRTALVIGLLFAVDPFGVFFANLLLTEVLFTFLLLAFVTAVLNCLERPREWSIHLRAALLGTALVLTRPSALLLLPLFWTVLAWSSRRRRASPVRLVIHPLVLVAALLPWGLRNKAVIGDFAWLSTNGGVTLYDAQGPQADGSSDQSFLNELPQLHGLGEAERDRLLRRLAREEMVRSPGRVLELAVTKFQRTWNPLPNVAEYRGGAAAAAGAAYSILVFGLAVAGLWRTWLGRRNKPRQQEPGLGYLNVFVWVTVAYFTLVHTIYIGSVRYRVPLMPLLLLAGVGAFGRGRGGGDRSSASGPAPMDAG